MTSAPSRIASKRRADALVVAHALRDITTVAAPALSESTNRLLVFEAALEEQLEQRILVLDDRALAERDGHVERRAMPAAEEVREIGRGERELAVADLHPGP